MAPAGETTWYDFAKKILQFALEKPEKFKVITQSITPISSSQYPAVAERPSNSVLSSGKLKKNFGVELGTWQEGLRHVFDIL